MNLHRLLATLLLAGLLSACGFHLREEARLPAGMQLIAIEGADASSPLGRDLRKALARSGAQLVEGSDEPHAVLRIGSNTIRTDVLSVGGNARANEFTIRYHVEFDVLGAAGDSLVARQTIELSRDFTFDATQALGIAAEQDLLTEELQHAMVQAILRKLEALAR
ncbi:LPS assembly lipoprotein LptE [Dokdonella sp.]|uniref:LPS-assembly lipoprotein LptE n=1 Tax=Dokdonella sp. TaxID=2291710 RepID=UPI002BADC148|nr:LPS assembly lipoprotein LptE [Dokdonella sp.]HOX73058.1 LPS assembly lipoprotein LptE [Dokdonella sp.]HPN80297.1 LPS assembly lipoprotein LptE [Dokdonella sp.]